MQDELHDDDDVLATRKMVEDNEIDITPMIDCVFLLLIFFLVSSKMAQPGKVTLPPSRHGENVVEKNGVVITISKGGANGAAQIFLGNGTDSARLLKGADPDQEDDALADYVAKEIVGKEYLLIKAEKDVKHRDIARVTKAVARVEDLKQLYVAVLEVR